MAPLNRITILLQTSDPTTRNLTMFQTAIGIWREEGIKAYWKGNLTSIFHRFPYSAINFSAYEVLRDGICGKGSISLFQCLFISLSLSLSLCLSELDEHRVSLKETPLIRFICGGLAGAIACTACYPIELVKTRLTVDKKRHYNGIIDTFTSVIRNEGFFGLYKGSLLYLSLPPSFSVSPPRSPSHWLLSCVDRIEPSSCGRYSIHRLILRLLWDSEIIHPPPQNPSPLQPFHRTADSHRRVGLRLCFRSEPKLSRLLFSSPRPPIGIVGSLFSYPVDLVRHRLQVKGFHALHNSDPTALLTETASTGAISEFRHIYK